MARSYYPRDLIVASGAGTPAVVTLAPGAAFTVWSAETGGSQYTDLLASDGTTALPTSGGSPFCDSNGIRPGLYGPNNVNTVLWCATSAISGSPRYPMYPALDLATSLTTGAKLNVAQSFTAAQTFTAAVAFSSTPTVSGSTVATQANLATLLADVPTMIAVKNTVGEPWFIYVNPSTGVWPNSGSRVSASGASLAALTTRVIWDSQSFQGASKPAGMIDGDFWDERP